ncbi:MAG: hydroxymethylbilane synthase [bacterium]|nr:hydroxymethylbilane synthase [bacterium]
MKSPLTIGTRGSDLALKQADITKRALLRAEPALEIEIQIIKTEGDTNQSPIPLDVVGKGWFTKEIEQALLGGAIDIATHSLKDLPESLSPGLHIGAYLEREDARDVLVSNNNRILDALPRGAVIGTDSLRRKVQILALRSDLVVVSIRGNVPTRIQKLASGDYDALVLASAGLKRLGMEDTITQYFEVGDMTPAPGQGTLALETKVGGAELQKLLTAIQDTDAAEASNIERSYSLAMGGGCKSPTGAYAFREGDQWVLLGMRADSSMRIVREEMRAPLGESAQLGEMLAKKLLGN